MKYFIFSLLILTGNFCIIKEESNTINQLVEFLLSHEWNPQNKISFGVTPLHGEEEKRNLTLSIKVGKLKKTYLHINWDLVWDLITELFLTMVFRVVWQKILENKFWSYSISSWRGKEESNTMFFWTSLHSAAKKVMEKYSNKS